MTCLTDAQIQAVVDREASDEERRHAGSCPRCAERLRDREARTTAVLSAMTGHGGIPPRVIQRVDQALADGTSSGATRLRPDAPRSSWRAAVWSGGVVVAATLLVVLVVVPAMIKGPTTVSAAEVLARSANQLAEQVVSGVELLEYELILDGVPREMMPDHLDGAYRVTQAIDHDAAGHYSVVAYDPSGAVHFAISQDPSTRTRVINLRVEDQPYRFELEISGNVALSSPELERLHMQASVAMMQASGNQRLELVETPAGRQYRIDVPQVSASTPAAVWDLSEARAVIDATDYHVVELAVKGTFLKKPYSVSYRLINRATLSKQELRGSEFEVPTDPAAVTIKGEGSAVPVRDALVLALRELNRLKRTR
jgi:hypothetical protein